MFIPLHDTNALKFIVWPFVTYAIVVLNVIAWAAMAASGADGTFTNAAVFGFGFIPAIVNDHAVLAPGLAIVPDWATYVTYAFLHNGFIHMATNMLFVWVFADNVEDALGHVRFILFYLACAVIAALVHGALSPESQAPLIGASGAVSGVVVAYVMLSPRARVWVLLLGRFPLPLPAFVPIALWIAYQFAMLATDHQEGVSWGAHAGGIVAGAVLVVLLKRREVALFDGMVRRHDTPPIAHGPSRTPAAATATAVAAPAPVPAPVPVPAPAPAPAAGLPPSVGA